MTDDDKQEPGEQFGEMVEPPWYRRVLTAARLASGEGEATLVAMPRTGDDIIVKPAEDADTAADGARPDDESAGEEKAGISAAAVDSSAATNSVGVDLDHVRDEIERFEEEMDRIPTIDDSAADDADGPEPVAWLYNGTADGTAVHDDRPGEIKRIARNSWGEPEPLFTADQLIDWSIAEDAFDSGRERGRTEMVEQVRDLLDDLSGQDTFVHIYRCVKCGSLSDDGSCHSCMADEMERVNVVAEGAVRERLDKVSDRG